MGRWGMGPDEKRADKALKRHYDREEAKGNRHETRVGRALQERADQARREGR